MEEIETYLVTKEEEGERLDRFLVKVCEGAYSRAFLQRLMKEGNVTTSAGIPLKASYKVRKGEEIFIKIPPAVNLEVLPENIPLDILYEDEDILVINKGKNMVVHPAFGHFTGTIVNAVLYHCKENLSGINGVIRPGIVHRIDRNTTGAIVICKNDCAHHFIAEQLKEHSIKRTYHALVYHPFQELKGTINAPIGRHPTERKKMAINEKNGKEAITHYQVIENLKGKYAYITCQLETGRTHQIRVHMASIHHPLLGDEVYGPNKNPFHLEGQALHAEELGFIHPRTRKYVEFHAPLPEYFTNLLRYLRQR